MRVFISYSHKDKDIVRQIADGLRQHGVEVWLDEDLIAPGEKWIDKINEAVEGSDAILVIMSRNTAGSRFQASEIAFAIATQRKDPGKWIIPVLVDKQADVPFFLKDISYCDLSSEDQYAKNFSSLIQTLSRPPRSGHDVRVSDRRLIEAIKAEKEILRHDLEALDRKKAVWTSTVLGAIASVLAALVTFTVGTFSTVKWMVNIFREWGDFLSGLLVGSLCVLVAFLVAKQLQKKSARKEVGDGE